MGERLSDRKRRLLQTARSYPLRGIEFSLYVDELKEMEADGLVDIEPRAVITDAGRAALEEHDRYG